jgi:hypothetical protein
VTSRRKLQARVAKGRLRAPAKIHQALGRLKERVPRVARYCTLAYDEATRAVTWTLNTELTARAEHLDGTYPLRTDRQDLNDDEVWRVYILLTRVEAAFRAMKSPLMERPIFHHLKHRVQTHIFLCVLAYHLLVAIEKCFLDHGVHTSWATLREQLAHAPRRCTSTSSHPAHPPRTHEAGQDLGADVGTIVTHT